MQDLEQEIRNAVGAGEFAKARQLWLAYGEALQSRIREGVATRSDLDQTAALIEWTRRSARCAQALAMQDLNALAVSGCYRPERVRPRPLMNITA